METPSSAQQQLMYLHGVTPPQCQAQGRKELDDVSGEEHARTFAWLLAQIMHSLWTERQIDFVVHENYIQT